LKKNRYERLLLTVAEMAREPSPDGSFQVSKLQPLKTLFRDLEAYREFVVMILAEVKSEAEKSAYSPHIPIADKIRFFEQVIKTVADSSEQGADELKKLNKQLYDLQPGWKRLSIHATRRKAADHHILLLEHAAKSFVTNRANSGFQLVCLYLSTFKEIGSSLRRTQGASF
jgi:hypothetical protein